MCFIKVLNEALDKRYCKYMSVCTLPSTLVNAISVFINFYFYLRNKVNLNNIPNLRI